MSFAHPRDEEPRASASASRRRRPLNSALAATAVVAAAFGLAAAAAPAADAAVPRDVAVAHHGTASVPPVVRVHPGVLAIGDGYSLTLTRDSVTLSDPEGGSVGPKSTDDGNQAPDSISMQIDGQAVGGLYIGARDAASATVTVGGTVYQATVVTLYGHPGWSEIYVVLPSAPDLSTAITNSVYDRAGHLLATFTNPGFPA